MTQGDPRARNPFGVQDVPDPDGADVAAFSGKTPLSEAADDPNATDWAGDHQTGTADSLEGAWSSRWNGGVDPTIPGDGKARWKSGNAKLVERADRIFLLFDWDDGRRRGLIEARRLGGRRLAGRYLNLSNPSVSRPWHGVIVDGRRIDGMWSDGRLDFRR